jgi:hypothetical protein
VGWVLLSPLWHRNATFSLSVLTQNHGTTERPPLVSKIGWEEGGMGTYHCDDITTTNDEIIIIRRLVAISGCGGRAAV